MSMQKVWWLAGITPRPCLAPTAILVPHFPLPSPCASPSSSPLLLDSSTQSDALVGLNGFSYVFFHCLFICFSLSLPLYFNPSMPFTFLLLLSFFLLVILFTVRSYCLAIFRCHTRAPFVMVLLFIFEKLMFSSLPVYLSAYLFVPLSVSVRYQNISLR